MDISFSQSFRDNLKRIDEVVVIDSFKVDDDQEKNKNLHVICHSEKVQICIEGVSGNCRRLSFYCSKEENPIFIITEENDGMIMNPERTIFEFNLPEIPKAKINCPRLTEDEKFLEGVGLDLGESLYKNISISEESLVWKDSLGKYVVDRGLQDNHSYEVELLDTKSGNLEERPIRFKSYQNIIIEQGNSRIDMLKRLVVTKHDTYDDISENTFFVWDSPMYDAKIDLSKQPDCINNLGNYLDPGKIVFGNTDCFQFINYQQELVGFRITGAVGSEVDILFNRESSTGEYTTFRCSIGEDGVGEVRFSDLPYLHLNGIQTVKPSKITKIENILYVEETIDEYYQNPDNIYVVGLNNNQAVVKIDGVCEYIEYEKYLGKITEIGRGTEHINSIPSIYIDVVESNGLAAEIDQLEKQIIVESNPNIGVESRYCTYQVIIDNNININGNILTTSPLYSDYKIRIEQMGITWKILNSPDYINGEDKYGIYTLGSDEGSIRNIEIITNDPRANNGETTIVQSSDGDEIFVMNITKVGQYDQEYLKFNVFIQTKGENSTESWRPRSNDDNPIIVKILCQGVEISSVFFYAIQLKKIEDKIEIWEETLYPGQFTRTKDKISLLNSMTKSFVVAKKVGNPSLTWYYYDILGTNKFYITDQGAQITNTGTEYLVSSETTLLDLGTGEQRTIFGRTINANRSDLIGSLGTLVVTESSAYPNNWKNLIDNNTAIVEVTRELDNIYIQVGKTQSSIKNEDIEIELDSICSFSLWIKSNFKYVIETFGYIKKIPDIFLDDVSAFDYPTEYEVLTNYNNVNEYEFVLIKLDDQEEMRNSYIEIRSGDLVRKVTVKTSNPKREHSYVLNRDLLPSGVNTNIIRVFKNGTFIAGDDNEFFYKSSTTPKFNYIEVDEIKEDGSVPVFYPSSGHSYRYHKTKLPITIPNSTKLSYSKYPMKSFGGVQELSLSYSDLEVNESLKGVIKPLDYLFFMKGKEHFLWCVENIDGTFSEIVDPTFPSGNNKTTTYKDVYIDSSGKSGCNLYIVSRYSVGNKTFITESPDKDNYIVRYNNLEAELVVSPQQKIELDEKSQIEYAIPITIKSNITNNGGNIYLGSFTYKAITTVTEDSIDDIIDVSEDIIELEGINENYIKNKLGITDKEQTLVLRVFQVGSENYSPGSVYIPKNDLPKEIWVDYKDFYIVPEIGKDTTFNSDSVQIRVKDQTGTPVVSEPNNADNKEILKISKEFILPDGSISPSYGNVKLLYFLYKAITHERVPDNCDKHWYSVSSGNIDAGIKNKIINDYDYEINLLMSIYAYGGSSYMGQLNTNILFKKYGHHYGFYIEGYLGFGNYEEYSLNDAFDVDEKGNGIVSGKKLLLPADGGKIRLKAGILYVFEGKIEAAAALTVPPKYEFIGENIPDDVLWEGGNLDANKDEGNLSFSIPPRLRNAIDYKKYILHITYPHEYYPLNLYVVLSQEPLAGSDTEKNNYRLEFLEEEVNILSNGSVVGDDKFYFTHNLTEAEFNNNVEFVWKMKNSSEFPSIDNLAVLEEVERSYKDQYVKFNFKPNGERIFIDAYIYARYNKSNGGKVNIGKISVKQGYYSLVTEFYNPYLASITSNFNSLESPMSRISPYSADLYKVLNQSFSNSPTPCKSSNDNSNASGDYLSGRSVYGLSVFKREYYDDAEKMIKFKDVFKTSSLDFISPVQILESYGLSLVLKSESDYDALVNPIFNNNYNYVTNTNFSGYCPYMELSYIVKEEFIREFKIITAASKITLRHPDSEDLVDFYILLKCSGNKSNEPANIDTFMLSDYSLRFGYEAGSKEVSYSPGSFYSNIQVSVSTDWLSASKVANSNIILITVEANTSTAGGEDTESTTAYLRTGQIRVDIEDDRISSENNKIIKTAYINIEQEPD